MEINSQENTMTQDQIEKQAKKDLKQSVIVLGIIFALGLVVCSIPDDMFKKEFKEFDKAVSDIHVPIKVTVEYK